LNILKKTFKNKNVIITGHTGFKGAWLTKWLLMLGANVRGISIDPITSPSLFEKLSLSKQISDKRINILNRNKLSNAINLFEPDFVFHLAAQALVKESYKDPLITWDTNLIGTINVISSLRKINHKCVAVIITSDKCYKNKELRRGYRENDELGGYDPYSASKGAAEIAIQSYIKSFFNKKNNPNVHIAIGRAGNVIGGGDWSKDRILPDCIRSWSNENKVTIRSPNSTRPWQHVLEPLSGYLSLAERLSKNNKLHGEAFNFGPSESKSRTVMNVVTEMSKYWNNVKWTIIPDNKIKEAGLLKLNCHKAYKLLKWKSNMNFAQTIKMTAIWYKSYYTDKKNITLLTEEQIDTFVVIAKDKNIYWSK
jgi:CDP-glucose 4,6-dehydratase